MFIFHFVRYSKEGKKLNLLTSALLAALLVYIRPIAYYLPVVIASIILNGN